MKEYAFLNCTEQNLQATFYYPKFTNGTPKHSIPMYPVTDLQGYINEGWRIIQTHIHSGICDRNTATYRFILEREVPENGTAP